MSDTVKKLLVKNVPEFLQLEETLVSYLEAAGTFLDGTREAIINFDWAYDYQNSSDYALTKSLNDIGFEIPPNVDKNVSRVVLRDAIHMFLKKGTVDSLIWVLRILGTEPEIRQAWVPTPQKIQKGYITDLSTNTTTRYDVSKFTYTDMIYGEVNVTENGTYLTGFKYEDVYSEEPINLIPIIGERYKTFVGREQESVAKTPYVTIRIKNQNFNVVTDSYTDPETGEVYEYAPNEQYRAIVELIEYFLFDTARPANVRVLIVASIHELAETIDIGEAYTEEFTWEDQHTIDDSPVVGDTFIDTVEIDVLNFSVGDPLFIGKFSPYTNQLEAIDVSTIAESGTYELIRPEQFQVFSVDTFIEPFSLFSRKILITINTTITFTCPVGETIEVYGIENFTNDPSVDGVLIDTVTSGNVFSQTFVSDYHAIVLKSTTGSIDEKILVEMNFGGY